MSLRGAVLALGAGCVTAGLTGFLLGAFPPALWFGGFGVLLLIGTAWERVRYKPLMKQAPAPGWQRTPERFMDPQTGLPVTVYADPAGERHYVQE